MSGKYPLRIGQRWASTDSRDVRSKHNQRRLLVGFDEHAAFFEPVGDRKPYRVMRTASGISRHRLVLRLGSGLGGDPK